MFCPKFIIELTLPLILLTGSRVIYASAQRHDFPKMFAVLYGHVAPAPMRALIFEGVWVWMEGLNSIALVMIAISN